MSSPALARFSASAGRLLRHVGGELSFRRLVSTKDPLLGSETWEPEAGIVTAGADLFQATRKKDGGVRERYDKLAVELGPFEARGGLSDEWEVLLDGEWTALENVMVAEDGTTWEAEISRGGGEDGS